MSEYSDVLYDPRTHTHTSCIQEVPNADMIVLLIGSRFGGKIIPEAINTIDIDKLISTSLDITILDEPDKLSITQLEVLKALITSVPVFAFVDERVMHDHHVYQKNKDIVDKIKFPSIEKQESAKYIFEFINFLTHRNKGNSVISFGRIEDIENHLRKQWGSLFQRLLKEEREKTIDSRKHFSITEQLEDLKTALLSTISDAQNKEVARGVIKYRRLTDFLSSLNSTDIALITESTQEFYELLHSAGIVSFRDISDKNSFGRTALVCSDNTFYELRFPSDYLSSLSNDWQLFKTLSSNVRKVIYEATNDYDRMGPRLLRYRNVSLNEYFKETEKQEEDDLTLEQFFKDEPQATPEKLES